MSRNAVSARSHAGRLHRVHRGVYAVGHPVLTVNGRRMAAVLAAGPGAVLSHASAAALWEIRRTSATRIDVTVRSNAGRARRPGLRIHRTPTLRDRRDHRAPTVSGSPRPPAPCLTSLPHCLAAHWSERSTRPRSGGSTTGVSSEAVALAHAGERGAAALQRALDDDGELTLTDSELEELMLALCDDHGLPRPQPRAWVAGLRVDFLFAAGRLVVETDGYRYHRTRRAFERDRERDAILARAGYRTLRFTHRQLTREPAMVCRRPIRSSA